MKRMVLGCGLLLLLSASPLQAEDSMRGRLPDGRAFRTDANGVQLVDYTAELELTIEELNRRVRALENELDETPRRAQPRMEERDILAQSAPKPMLPGQRQRAASNGFDCPVCPVSVGDEELSRLKAENSILRTKLNSNGSAFAGSEEILERKNEIIEQQRERIAALLEKVSSIESEAQGYRKELTASKRDEETATPIAFREGARASFRPSNERALLSTRSALQSDMNRLQGFIRTRALKYKSYASRGKNSVSFQLTPAVSSRGLNVSQIKPLIKEAATLEDLADLKRDIKDIKSKVRDDIALIERMKR